MIEAFCLEKNNFPNKLMFIYQEHKTLGVNINLFHFMCFKDPTYPLVILVV